MMKKLQKGFTLIELLVVIAVLGILAAVVLVAINPQSRIQEARNAGIKSDIGQIGTALESYFTENGGSYPTATADLTDDEQLKNFPAPPTGRDGTNCETAYQYITGSSEAAVYADLEPCGTGEEYYVYWTACGKAVVNTSEPATTDLSAGVSC